MHEPYRMPRIVIDPDTLAAHRKRISPGLRAAIVVISLLLLVGMLEVLHRGSTAFILSLLKIAAVAIWNMLCNIAVACREFMEYVDRQRS